MNSLKLLLIALSIILTQHNLLANSMQVIEYQTNSFPSVNAKVFHFDQFGNALYNLNVANYSVSDNGALQTLQNIICPPTFTVNSSSIVFSFDRGLSAGDTSMNCFNISKSIIDTMTKLLDYSKTRVAVTSYDLWSNLQTDFTSNIEQISRAIERITPAHSSSCQIGFQSEPAGSLVLSASSEENRSIILLTQGIVDFNVHQIIQNANKNNISIYILYIGKPAPTEFKRIAKETGGLIFDNITSKMSIMPIIYSLVNYINGKRPCDFLWFGEFDCSEDHEIIITDTKSNAKCEFRFIVSETAKPTIYSNPPYLEFSSVPIGQNLVQEITLQAVNADIVITATTINEPQFAIIQGNITNTKILYQNTTHTLRIRYSPIDSAIVFTKLIIQSNACFGSEIYITGGFPNRPPKTKTIEIVAPACGETLVIGDFTEVRWQGLLPKDVIQLEYSPDDGTNWYALAKNTENLSYNWAVPHIETDKLMIRAIQLWPNNVGRTMDLRHRNAVNSAFFNRKGDRVITASDDSAAIIWNSNNGERLHIFRNHLHRVNYAIFDYDGKHAITASEDGYMRIFDSEDGSLIRTFRHDNHSGVLSVDVNQEGRRIVSVAKDNKIYLWDFTGSLIKQIPFNSDQRPQFAAFNPAGDVFLVVADDGIARFYSSEGDIVKSFDTKAPGEYIAYSKHGIFNTDGSKIAVTNDIKKNVMVFDYNTGNHLYSLTHNFVDTSNIFINTTSFFYNPDDDTEYILTSATDHTTRRWIARDGSRPKGMDGKDTLHLFKEHNNWIMISVFNFDGSRLLTACWDSTAKIWNLNQRDLQMDTTDCYLRIGRARIQANDIDFGDVLIDDVSIITQGFIRNLTDFKFDVRSVRLIGGNEEDFIIIDSPFSPFVLNDNELKSVSIRFEPKGAGIRKTFAEIIIPNDTIYAEILGYGVDLGLKATTYLVNFGKTETDEFKDSTFASFITNKSTTTITIDTIYFDGPDNEHFDYIISNIRPIVLLPNASLDLTIRFTPEILGRLNGILVFEHNGPGRSTRINLFGEGIPPIIDTISISLGDLEGKPGEIVELPITIVRLSENGAFRRAKFFDAAIAFNATLLEPLGDFISDDIIGGTRSIRKRFTYNQENEINNYTIRFKIGLGNDSISIIKLYDVSTSENAKLVINSNSSMFKLLGICYEGGARLFDSESGRSQLMQNRPNPFAKTTNIDFELIEPGYTKLTIYDLTGMPIKVVFDEYKQTGRYSVQLDADEFAVGLYYYILETPTRRNHRTMQVVR